MNSDAERAASPAAEEVNDQPAAVLETDERHAVVADKEAEPTAPSTKSEAPVVQSGSDEEAPQTSTTSTEPALPKLNPGATEFISRSSSAGPGSDAKTPSGQSSRRGQNARAEGNLSQSRHAGPRGAPIRQNQHSTANNQHQLSHDPTANPATENPVQLANPVDAANGVNAAGMTGFRPPRAPREPRPPRGYIPPAPERKVCRYRLAKTRLIIESSRFLQARLTADELEEKMAKMRLLNEQTQAEQEVSFGQYQNTLRHLIPSISRPGMQMRRLTKPKYQRNAKE